MTMEHLTDEHINAYIDGECSDAERSDALAHIAVCEQCARVAQEYAGIKLLLGQLEPVAPPRSFVLPAEFAGATPIASPSIGVPATPGNSTLRRLEPVARLLSIAAVLAFLVLGGGQMAGWIGDDDTTDSGPSSMSETDPSSSALQEEEPALARGELREQGDSAATGAGSLMSQPARVDTPTQVSNDLTPLELTTVGIGVIALVAIAGWILIHYRAGSAG